MSSRLEIQSFPLWDRLNDRRVPLEFTLEVTARCNLDCRHCYINLPAGDREARRRELSLEELDSIASEAVSLGALWCLISGGEPLLRKDFPELYLGLKRKGLLLSVFTNACLVTREHVRLFREYPPRDVEVTVYGCSEETYARVTRRRGSYAAFRRGLDLLQDAGVRVRLKAMALRSNVHELPEVSRFCRERTKDYFRFDPLLHLRFDRDPRRNVEIRSERLSTAEIVAIEQADEQRRSSLRSGCRELNMPQAADTNCDHLFHCGAGNGGFTVGSDGLFRLCSSLWHPDAVYDLRKGSVADAWTNFVPRIRGLRSHRQEFLGSCRVCPIINLCQWCPAHADLEAGAMDAHVGYFCEVAHARSEALKQSVPGQPAADRKETER